MQKLPIVTALSAVEIKKVYGQSILDFYQQVTKFLASGDTTDELKHFFAEPTVNITRGEISWYTSLSGKPFVISSLDDRQRDEIPERLTDIFRRIAQIHGGVSKAQGNNSFGAEAIRGMLTAPDLMQSLFMVDGKLVLAEWGCIPFGSLPSRFDLIVPENRKIERLSVVSVADVVGLPSAKTGLFPEALPPAGLTTETKSEFSASPTSSETLQSALQEPQQEAPIPERERRLMPLTLIGQSLVLVLLVGLLIFGILDRKRLLGATSDEEAVWSLKNEIAQLWREADAKSKSCASSTDTRTPSANAERPAAGQSQDRGVATPSPLPVPKTPSDGEGPDAGRPSGPNTHSPSANSPTDPGLPSQSQPSPNKSPVTAPTGAGPDAWRPSGPLGSAPPKDRDAGAISSSGAPSTGGTAPELGADPVAPPRGPGLAPNQAQPDRLRVPPIGGSGPWLETPNSSTPPVYYRSGPSTRGQELMIPNDPNDLTFLQGCWQADGQINETSTGAPLNAQACFPGTNGVGAFSYSFADGRRCEGPLKARRDGRDVVMEHGEIRCRDGAAFPSARVICRTGTGAAICDIVEIINGFEEPVAQRAPSTRFLRLTDTSTERRLQLYGSARGRLEISLSWNTIDDLDLSVTCPGGAEINFQSMQACGGRLVLDMNAGTQTVTNPVEHVIWDEMPNFGSVHIGVTLYKLREVGVSVVPYKVTVMLDNRIINEYQSKLSAPDRNQEKAEFTIPNRPTTQGRAN